jgi:hypothetical protein
VVLGSRELDVLDLDVFVIKFDALAIITSWLLTVLVTVSGKRAFLFIVIEISACYLQRLRNTSAFEAHVRNFT